VPLVVYHVPYRTAQPLTAAALHRLAATPNITGIKLAPGVIDPPVVEFLAAPPEDFTVLVGDDVLLAPLLAMGAHGGILASAHIDTARFAAIRDMHIAGDQPGALRAWRELVDLPRLLFAEPSPAPIKRWLWRAGLIDSPEVRLPMTQVSDALAARIDREVERTRMAA